VLPGTGVNMGWLDKGLACIDKEVFGECPGGSRSVRGRLSIFSAPLIRVLGLGEWIEQMTGVSVAMAGKVACIKTNTQGFISLGAWLQRAFYTVRSCQRLLDALKR
jgi:hypothetical protein